MTTGDASLADDLENRRSAGVAATLVEYLHACPVCFCARLRHYCRVASLYNPGQFLNYDRCSECGTVLRNPRLPAAYRLDRYEEQILPPEAKRHDPRSQLHYWFMMQVISRLAPAGARRLLDFGCGAGGFLVEARAAGFAVTGLELNRDLARHVEETYDIPVYQGLIGDAVFAGERFNVVVTSQVFEHLLDPRETLQHLRRHLDPLGLLLVEVPNLRDTRERCKRGSTMDDSHLFYFNRYSLALLLRECGFRVLSVHEGLRPYHLIGSLARRMPVALLAALERGFSLCQLKTVLGVIAALEDR